MIPHIEPTGAKAGAPICRLKVVLSGTKPPVWRRLQVPGNANLGWLHAVLQVAMGWTNSHLHQFRFGDQVCSDPAFQLEEYGGDPPMLDDNNTILMNARPRAGAVLRYEYDFGDSWSHVITVGKLTGPDRALAGMARCLDGARACPPEDCGGVWGYANLLKIIKNPRHKEHKSMLEWLGGRFDPEAFDREKVNTYLGKLEWPRVSVSQLRKVLMARDGYHE
ncbi:MAG: plasmid pRiA4b ORF-3 family protein [Verrucomicrobiota bacterium]|jgi:hypothetical protein